MQELRSAEPARSDGARAFPYAQPLLLFALLVVIALVYWPGLSGGYTFDDYPNIVDNLALHVTKPIWNDWLAAVLSSPSGNLQRPLAMLTFAINHYFTGLDPRPMKLTNLAIHLLNTLLVFGLVRSLVQVASSERADRPSTTTDWAALFTTAIWSLHPINLMAVLFVVQRMESLCHVFVFGGLWLYVLGRQRQLQGNGGRLLVLAGLIPCTLLGSLAKESAFLLPLYAFCLESCLFRFRSHDLRPDRWLLGLYGIVLVLPVFAGLAWLLPRAMNSAAFDGRGFTLAERLLTEPRVVLSYLHWILIPELNQLSLYHDDFPVSRNLWSPATTFFSILVIPALLAMAWAGRRRRPLASLGLFWFLGAQLLTATIVPLELVFEHRNYFASLGICLVLADLLLLGRHTAAATRGYTFLALAFLVFFAATTHLRAREWSDPVRFSTTEAAKRPQSPRATYDLARVLVVLTDYQPSSPYIAETFSAIERARRVPGSNILPDSAALIFAARIGMPLKSEWWADMQAKLRQHPIGPQELGAIGAITDCTVAEKCNFPHQDMLATFAAASSQGEQPEVLSMHGNYALNVLGETELTLRLWQRASELNPEGFQYHIALAKLYSALGRYDDARAQISKLRTIGRMGQYNSVADSLQLRLQSIKRARGD